MAFEPVCLLRSKEEEDYWIWDARVVNCQSRPAETQPFWDSRGRVAA